MIGAILSNIPFIGKYKRQLGAVLTVGGVVADVVGYNELGSRLREYGVAVLGIGVAHAEVKERRRGTR